MDGRSGNWRISLGGSVEVRSPDGESVAVRARKARGLIAYLAMLPDRTASRAELVAVLWSDRGREQARASLRQCLFELRHDAPGLVDADGEAVMLAAATVAEPRRDSMSALADLDALDPAFDRWVGTRRRDWSAAETPVPAPVAPTSAAPPVPKPPRHWLWPAVAIGLAGVAAMGGWLGLRPSAPHPPAVALTPLAGSIDPATRAAAGRFAESARTMMAATRIRLQPGADPSRADWIVGGAVGGEAATVRVTTPAGALLWTAREAGDPGGVAAAADRLAHRTARALTCAAGGPPTRRDTAATALLMQFCDVMQSSVGGDDYQATVALARHVVAVAPRDAYAHGHLAASLAFAAAEMPPPLSAPARVEAEAEAAHALALDTRTGEAWLARVMLARDRRDRVATEAAIRSGLTAEPDNPQLPNFLAHLLADVGRLDEALVQGQRALALDPASPAKRATVAELLLRVGSPRAAFAVLDDPGVYDPSHVLARERVTLLLWRGDTAGVRAALAAAGDAFEPAAAASLIARTRAIDDPHGPVATMLIAQVAATRDDPEQALDRVLVLASLGRTDAALDEALRAPIDPQAFFRPNTRALLLSPRFPAVARFQGLWAYWTTTGHWPDICTDPALGWRCPVKNPSTPR